MQRIKNRAQFDAAMGSGTVSRTPHFVLHRAPLAAPADHDKVLFAVQGEPWIGAVVPKRWAKRAVTRNGIKRQIYNVSASFEQRLPQAAHVVRLRMDFARTEYPSAWSDVLKAAVRGELLQLFEKATAKSVVPAQAGTHDLAKLTAAAVIPAQAGTHDPAKRS